MLIRTYMPDGLPAGLTDARGNTMAFAYTLTSIPKIWEFKPMFLRTLLLALTGLIAGAIGFIVSVHLAGDSSLQGIYLPSAAGFFGGQLAIS